jgi:outer membrane lipoprotein-sorting protein
LDNVPRIKLSVFAGILAAGYLAGIDRVDAQSWTIDAVMEGLRGLQHFEATFDETRHSTFLKTPIKLNGTFVYTAPQTFIKETFKPFPEIVTVDSNGVKIEQDKETQEGQSRIQFIAADAHPLVKGLVDGAEATMSGNKELLESRYELELNGSNEQWSVKLVPREKALRKKIESLLFTGSGDLIDSVEIRESDGDLSVINLKYELVERN